LSIFQQLKVCTHYNYKGKKIDYFPYDITDKNVSPVYKELKGWNQDITKLNNIDELPAELNDYIQFIEEQVEVPVTIVSVGPDRTQTLIREKAFA
jgi:adenylosuccinate synthase